MKLATSEVKEISMIAQLRCGSSGRAWCVSSGGELPHLDRITGRTSYGALVLAMSIALDEEPCKTTLCRIEAILTTVGMNHRLTDAVRKKD